MKKEWVLTGEGLDKLFAYLDVDRELAAEKYEDIRQMLITYFEFRGCVGVEDLTDETMNRVIRRMGEGKEIYAEAPSGYFYGVARNVFREYLQKRERLTSSLEDLPEGHLLQAPNLLQQTEAEHFEREKQLHCLDTCLQILSPGDQELIRLYYQGEKQTKIKNRGALAGRLAIPINALRLRAGRIRAKLEQCINNCMKQHPGI
jgi:RNA polymerase sigma factor (sigma-70 family)